MSTLDDKIQLNTQINQTLEQIAQAIFKSWFIDFDPVKATIAVLADGGSAAQAEHAAMRTISGKTDDELNQMQQTQPEQYKTLEKTTALFPCEMVDSELGDVPKGWDVSSIGKEVETVGGATPSTKTPSTKTPSNKPLLTGLPKPAGRFLTVARLHRKAITRNERGKVRSFWSLFFAVNLQNLTPIYPPNVSMTC